VNTPRPLSTALCKRSSRPRSCMTPSRSRSDRREWS
jgi:hypothetical protein